jgi:hypothetical protein
MDENPLDNRYRLRRGYDVWLHFYFQNCVIQTHIRTHPYFFSAFTDRNIDILDIWDLHLPAMCFIHRTHVILTITCV